MNKEQPTVPVKRSRAFGITSMVLGIISVLTILFLGGILGVLAVIFGIVGLVKKSGRGFAIAGIITGVVAIIGTLIYLLVLLSLPALQRNQADTKRKADTGYLMSQVTAYQSENQGSLPAEADISSVIDKRTKTTGYSFIDPSGEPYRFVSNAPSMLGEMEYKTEAVCVSENGGFKQGSAQQAAVIVKLNSGTFCTNN